MTRGQYVKTRILGNEGLVVSEIGLACVGMPELYGPSER
jgi:hypothetical protein